MIPYQGQKDHPVGIVQKVTYLLAMLNKKFQESSGGDGPEIWEDRMHGPFDGHLYNEEFNESTDDFATDRRVIVTAKFGSTSEWRIVCYIVQKGNNRGLLRVTTVTGSSSVTTVPPRGFQGRWKIAHQEEATSTSYCTKDGVFHPKWLHCMP